MWTFDIYSKNRQKHTKTTEEESQRFEHAGFTIISKHTDFFPLPKITYSQLQAGTLDFILEPQPWFWTGVPVVISRGIAFWIPEPEPLDM